MGKRLFHLRRISHILLKMNMAHLISVLRIFSDIVTNIYILPSELLYVEVVILLNFIQRNDILSIFRSFKLDLSYAQRNVIKSFPKQCQYIHTNLLDFLLFIFLY